MADAADLRAIALDLAAQFQLEPAEVAARADHARDAQYWQTLSPHIHIGAAPPLEIEPLESSELDRCARDFQHARYFQSPRLLAGSSLLRLNAIVDAITAAGWPPVFASVSDEFWQCARLPAIQNIVGARIGANRQASQLWIHVVPAVDRAGGWMPHFDGIRDERVTVWIALTNATLDNGCIYLVPPDSLPASMRTMDLRATIAMTDVMTTLHGARALPIDAGAAIGWDFDVLHWGGRTSRPESSRRAISMVYVANRQTPCADEQPLLDLDELPSFEVRLAAITRAIRLYGEREPMARRFLPVARLLAQRS
jgi:hypothetical protein